MRNYKNNVTDNLSRGSRLKTIMLCVAACLVLLFTSACGGVRVAGSMDKDILLTINDEECTVAEAVFRLMEVKDYYKSDEDELFWDRQIGDITFDEYIKQSVESEMSKCTAAVIIADRMAITLTQEEITELTNNASASYTELSSRYDMGSYGITNDTAIALYTKQALYSKVFNKLAEDLNSRISEADTKVIEVNYVMLPTSVSVNQAEELRQEIKSGTDFGTACRNAGYEPEMSQIIKKGDMPSAFENVAYALLDGELSEVVETADGLYIIQCLEDYLIGESVANKNKVLSEAREEEFNNEYLKLAADAEYRFNSSVWDEIDVRTLD